MPNITTNHDITYTNTVGKSLFSGNYFLLDNPWLIKDSLTSKLSLRKLLYYELFSKYLLNMGTFVLWSLLR